MITDVVLDPGVPGKTVNPHISKGEKRSLIIKVKVLSTMADRTGLQNKNEML
jgi:hypothetical protein